MDRQVGREALIFCWFLLVFVGLPEIYESRNQVYVLPYQRLTPY